MMAHEFAPYGIRVNCVAPRGINLGLPFPAAYQRKLEKATPLGRLGQPDEVAHVVALLASSAAAYVSGVVLPVDGGRTAVTAGTAYRPSDALQYRDASRPSDAPR